MNSYLTNTEFCAAYCKAKEAFSNKSLAEMYADIYGIRREKATDTAERLWLYMYALNTWNNDDTNNNYLTETQVAKIISKVQQYGS